MILVNSFYFRIFGEMGASGMGEAIWGWDTNPSVQLYQRRLFVFGLFAFDPIAVGLNGERLVLAVE